jgi:DNA end-binding protein Ku
MAATVWRGRIAFGLVSIPVRLYKAARRERARFHRVVRQAAEELAFRSGPALVEPEPPEPAEEPDEVSPSAPAPGPVTRVHNAAVAGPANEPVANREVFRGYEVARDEYVVLQPAEIAALRPRTSTALEIVQFVSLGEIDPVYFDTSYHVIPDPGGEKPYALLFRALAETRQAALGTLAMHGREHATVIRPGAHGLILHTLFFANEVGSANEFHADTAAVAAKELDMAKLLVGALEAKFDPASLKDTYEERLRTLIESRAPQPVASEPQPPERSAAPAVDIMDALRKSLEQARKPAAREESVEQKPRRRRAK